MTQDVPVSSDWDVPSKQHPLCGRKVFQMEFRSYYKPSGTNPEIEGPFYELSSSAQIIGSYNFEAHSLGFKNGSLYHELVFSPVDLTKPIVIAIDDVMNLAFIYIDQHLAVNADKPGMVNYKPFKTDKFLLDCQRRGKSYNTSEYWSIVSGGMTFVYSQGSFPGAWQVPDLDLLCAFVAGDLTANQLRMHSYLAEREAVKEERREEHIKRLATEKQLLSERIDHYIAESKAATDSVTANIKELDEEYEKLFQSFIKLLNTLRLTGQGRWPLVRKATIRNVTYPVLEEYINN